MLFETLKDFIILGSIGLTIEIFFTAVNIFFQDLKKSKINIILKGHSYIWMFFIYGSISLIFPPFYEIIQNYNLIIRLFAYGFGILIFEFIFGSLLEKITGKCPWKYSSKYAIKGYIRLDYLPLWMLFGYIIELIHLYLL